MLTPTRAALMGKSTADLVHMLRLMGADSPSGEAKESIVSRILMFQRQEFGKEKPRIIKPIIPLDEEHLREALASDLSDGMTLEVRDGCWYIAWGDKRKDSGSLMQPVTVVQRCAKYLRPRVWPEPVEVETANPIGGVA